MRNYTIFVDGISKSLAATGLRVGWGFGPKKIISKMSEKLKIDQPGDTKLLPGEMVEKAEEFMNSAVEAA